MGRLISIIIFVVVLVVKYFAYRYFDNKKNAKDVEKSKTVWTETFKAAYMADCTRPTEAIDPSIAINIYCGCEADRAQQAAAFPTAYNADEETQEQYQAELERLSNAYFESEIGKKNTEECLLAAQVK